MFIVNLVQYNVCATIIVEDIKVNYRYIAEKGGKRTCLILRGISDSQTMKLIIISKLVGKLVLVYPANILISNLSMTTCSFNV